MRRIAVIALLLAATGAGGAVAGSASEERSRTVPCRESIDGTTFPYVGGFERRLRYRLVLGAVSAPPAYLEQEPSPTGSARWRYFSKKGLVVRAGRQQPVFVSVVRAWRDRAGIAWATVGTASSARSGSPAVPDSRTRGTHTRAASICVRVLCAFHCCSAPGDAARSSASALVAAVRRASRPVGEKSRFRYNQGQTLEFGTCRFSPRAAPPRINVSTAAFQPAGGFSHGF